MTTITYVDLSGSSYAVDVENGVSVMEGAVHNNVPGIDAECGGSCVCATCHVYVDAAWKDKVGEANEVEAMTLEELDRVASNSRLSCQIRVTEELDGLTVHLPESQN